MDNHPMLATTDPGLPAWLARRPITVSDYYKMAEVGILTEHDRVELIEGQIIEMVPIGSEHAGKVNNLTYLLVTTLGTRAVVSVQNPVRLSNILEPEPDFAVLKPRPDRYAGGHPTAADVLLLIEVADSSLNYDRIVKARLYARHGVPELWVVDIKARRITVHRNPIGDAYTDITERSPADTLEIAALPGATISAAEVFP
jgi:Uma2 family endonuclease